MVCPTEAARRCPCAAAAAALGQDHAFPFSPRPPRSRAPGKGSDGAGSGDGRTAPDHRRGGSITGDTAAQPPGGAGHSPGCAQTALREAGHPRGSLSPAAPGGAGQSAAAPRPPRPAAAPVRQRRPPGGAAQRCPFKAAQPRAHSSGRVTVPGSWWRHAAIPPAVHPAAAGRAPGNKGGIKIEGERARGAPCPPGRAGPRTRHRWRHDAGARLRGPARLFMGAAGGSRACWRHAGPPVRRRVTCGPAHRFPLRMLGVRSRPRDSGTPAPGQLPGTDGSWNSAGVPCVVPWIRLYLPPPREPLPNLPLRGAEWKDNSVPRCGRGQTAEPCCSCSVLGSPSKEKQCIPPGDGLYARWNMTFPTINYYISTMSRMPLILRSFSQLYQWQQ